MSGQLTTATTKAQVRKPGGTMNNAERDKLASLLARVALAVALPVGGSIDGGNAQIDLRVFVAQLERDGKL